MKQINAITRAAVLGEEGGVPVRQGQMVDVFSDRLVIRRRDFVRDEDLDEAWLLEMPTKASPFSARAARSAAPAFFQGAGMEPIVTFEQGPDRDGKKTDQVAVSFYPAIAEKSTRPFDYELTLEAREADVEAVVRTFRFYSPTAMLAKRHDEEAEPHGCVRYLKYLLARSELPQKAEFRFAVRALNCYGVKSAPIFTKWTRVP
jgi:hypothetical protein